MGGVCVLGGSVAVGATVAVGRRLDGRGGGGGRLDVVPLRVVRAFGDDLRLGRGLGLGGRRGRGSRRLRGDHGRGAGHHVRHDVAQSDRRGDVGNGQRDADDGDEADGEQRDQHPGEAHQPLAATAVVDEHRSFTRVARLGGGGGSQHGTGHEHGDAVRRLGAVGAVGEVHRDLVRDVHRDLVLKRRTSSRGPGVMLHRSLSDPQGGEALLVDNHEWATRRYRAAFGRHPHAGARARRRHRG